MHGCFHCSPRKFSVSPGLVLSCDMKRIMIVFVNNQAVLTPEATSLRSLLTQLALAEKKGIAVAVNNAIVPRLAWEHFIVSENEKITILQATQGG